MAIRRAIGNTTAINISGSTNLIFARLKNSLVYLKTITGHSSMHCRQCMQLSAIYALPFIIEMAFWLHFATHTPHPTQFIALYITSLINSSFSLISISFPNLTLIPPTSYSPSSIFFTSPTIFKKFSILSSFPSITYSLSAFISYFISLHLGGFLHLHSPSESHSFGNLCFVANFCNFSSNLPQSLCFLR